MRVIFLTMLAVLIFKTSLTGQDQISIANNQYHLYGPNSTWGQYLKVGGNGRGTTHASVVATNGNLHLDSRNGAYSIYLNYYSLGNTYLNSSGGNVGIGTTSTPTQRLQVVGSAQFGESFNHSGIGGTAGARVGIRHSVADGYAPMLLMVHSARATWDLGVHHDQSLRIRNFDTDEYRLIILKNGNIGIGTTTPSEKLSVNGTIRSKEVKVEAAPWPDYVFSEDYELKSLEETEAYIKEHQHLPDMPSAAEVAENGVALGEMNRLLLEKVEELTLHLIEKDKREKELITRIEKLESQLK